MINTKNVYGFLRIFKILQIKLAIFFHYLPMAVSGKIPLRRFVLFLKRLLFFLSHLEHNKFVEIHGKTRLDLYVPGFPSRAFYTACGKFLEFGRKLPCATVLISVTSACRFSCAHCYQRLDKGKDMPLDRLLPVVGKLQDMGVAFFNIEGGEPFLVYDRLKAVCEAIDDRSEIWINSTGEGMTLERLLELRRYPVTAIMFSLHSPQPEKLNAFMGSPKAWATLEEGVRLCHEAGIAVAFNMCLGRQSFHTGDFESIMEQAYRFKAAIIQLIKPKPAGGWLDGGFEPFIDADIKHVCEKVNLYNHDRRYRKYPSISAQIMEESPAVFGCTGGGTDRFYINAKGDVQPCEFLNISFGNIITDDFDTIYAKMRQVFDKPGDRMMCEAMAQHIATALAGKSPAVLPLNPEASLSICQDWDRGNATGLYQIIEEEMK